MQETIRLAVDRFADTRMPVPKTADRNAGNQVQVAASVRINQLASFRMGKYQAGRQQTRLCHMTEKRFAKGGRCRIVHFAR